MMHRITLAKQSRVLRLAGPKIAAARPYSILSKLKQAKVVVDTIADDRTDISKTTLKYFRRIGVLSIFVALGSLAWSSTMVEPIIEPIDEVDLSADVRSWK